MKDTYITAILVLVLCIVLLYIFHVNEIYINKALQQTNCKTIVLEHSQDYKNNKTITVCQ